MAVRAGCQLGVLSSICSGQAGPWKFCVRLVCTHRGWQLGDPLWPVFQEAVFNKNTGQVVLKTFSLYRKLLTLLRAGHDQGEARGVGTRGVAGGC